MDPSLVDLITEMVMAELARSGDSPVGSLPAESSPGGRRLLVAAAAGVPQEAWEALRSIPDVQWLGVAWPGAPAELLTRQLGARPIAAPSLWDDMVTGVEAVVLPAFPLEFLSKLALLLPEPAPVAAALAGVVQGVPVLASNLEVDRIRRHSARLPAGFLQVFSQHVRVVEGMGVQLLEPAVLAQRLSGRARPPHTGPARGRDVVTMEDLEAARRAGQKVLELAPGTIVTPLARDAARQMGIEVHFR